MILIDSLFINTGGGKVLLKYLIDNLPDTNKRLFFIFDKRLESEFKTLDLDCVFMNPSLFERHIFYRSHKNDFEIVFTFANLPPTIRLSCTVITFFQNVLLVDAYHVTISLYLKRILFRLLFRNSDIWITQSNYIKEKLERNLWQRAIVMVLPFYEEVSYQHRLLERNLIDKDDVNFIFVSSGEIHKNHIRLFEAFIEVNIKEPRFSLTVTIGPEYPSLLSLIHKMKAQNIKINNIGSVSRDKIILEYSKADVCIFPSLNESFGLGLIEAVQFGLPILASDLPYVREVVTPSFCFNPLRVDSISSAMLNCRKYTNKKSVIVAQNNIYNIINLLGINR